MSATKLLDVIGVWLDETPDVEWTAWVVSRVGVDPETLAIETAADLVAWRLDETPDAEQRAITCARQAGLRKGLPVYRFDSEHPPEILDSEEVS